MSEAITSSLYFINFLTTSLSYTSQFYNNYQTQKVDKSRSFNILTLSVGINKRLTVPDDNSYLSQAISYQHYDLHNYNIGLFTFGNGASRNLAYTIGFTHSNKGINPIFPTYGSEFSLTGKYLIEELKYHTDIKVNICF